MPSPLRFWLRGAPVSDFEEYQKRRGVTRETWSIQETPDGSAFSVVWIESPDPAESIAEGAQDASDFGVWFRERVKEINGIDLDPSPAQGARSSPSIGCRRDHVSTDESR